MTRHALATEALQLSRSILAAVPVRVRVASIVHGFLREAFTRDDMALSMGIQALLSMEKAGTPGNIEGHSIEELRPYIKRNTLSKLKPIAKAIGSRIYSMSMAGKRNIPLTIAEEAWTMYTATLEKHPLSGSHNVGQAIKYMADGFTMRIKDVLDGNKRRQEIRADPDFGPSVHREHEQGPGDRALWNQVERKFKSDPLLLGPNGEPWAWIYLDGKSGGLSEEQIIAAWNDASRRNGGPGDMNRHRYLSWLTKNSERTKLMRGLAKAYLDDATIERLKIAVDSGGLGRVLLSPWERDLLTLLV
jgi:hypothetical protein